MGNASKTQTSVTLDTELMIKGRELAKLDRRSFSSWLELAMAKEIRSPSGQRQLAAVTVAAPAPAAKPAAKAATKTAKKAAKKAKK